MKTTDLMMLIVDAVGGQVEGRTVAQKLAYFVGVQLDEDLSHQAHFYGPFSRDVEDALDFGVLSGGLEESVERIPDWYGGPDLRRYSYALSALGSKRVKKLKVDQKAVANRVRLTVSSILASVPELRQKTLSSAAKIHFIVTESGDPVAVQDIPKLADHLGWKLDEEEVKNTTELLRKLELAT